MPEVFKPDVYSIEVHGENVWLFGDGVNFDDVCVAVRAPENGEVRVRWCLKFPAAKSVSSVSGAGNLLNLYDMLRLLQVPDRHCVGVVKALADSMVV